jgi:tetratricopeptide (TPR) repeat protein
MREDHRLIDRIQCRRRGRSAEARAALEHALAQPAVAPGLRARALRWLGWVAFSQADLNAAEEAAKTYLKLSRKARSQTGVASSLLLLGAVKTTQGDRGEGRRLTVEAARIFREQGHPGAIEADNSLGVIALDEQDFDAAVELFERARDESEHLGLPLGIVENLWRRGSHDRTTRGGGRVLR